MGNEDPSIKDIKKNDFRFSLDTKNPKRNIKIVYKIK